MGQEASGRSVSGPSTSPSILFAASTALPACGGADSITTTQHPVPGNSRPESHSDYGQASSSRSDVCWSFCWNREVACRSCPGRLESLACTTACHSALRVLITNPCPARNSGWSRLRQPQQNTGLQAPAPLSCNLGLTGSQQFTCGSCRDHCDV